ncbi:unnamed protein product [Protopolystoma xenopodis]|uniref:Splicing factor 45 n=1 Tax=Protopolystoma xenopodis TaxID=117903 RepID=A0A3S5C3W4_9PLAT|nr:unnamed protein product [Protopolystoma xenopodis]
MMARMGYREGQGLGREGQGMSTALVVEKTSRRGGKIIHERDRLHSLASTTGQITGGGSNTRPGPRQEEELWDDVPGLIGEGAESGEAPLPLPPYSSSVILLRNMCGPGEVDDDLEPETAEECAKYGPVVTCMIFELPNASDDEAVRIFVEFTCEESANKGESYIIFIIYYE